MLFAAPPSWHETSARAAYFDTVKISIDAGNAANCKYLYSGKIVSNCGVRAAARIRGPNQGRRAARIKRSAVQPREANMRIFFSVKFALLPFMVFWVRCSAPASRSRDLVGARP